MSDRVFVYVGEPQPNIRYTASGDNMRWQESAMEQETDRKYAV